MAPASQVPVINAVRDLPQDRLPGTAASGRESADQLRARIFGRGHYVRSRQAPAARLLVGYWSVTGRLLEVADPQPADALVEPPVQGFGVVLAILGGPAHDEVGEVALAFVGADGSQDDGRFLVLDACPREQQMQAMPRGEGTPPVTPPDALDAVLASQSEGRVGRADLRMSPADLVVTEA